MATFAAKLKGAVIGCGFFAANHLNAWAEIDGVEIVAVCDLDPAKARWPGARSYADAAAMLEAERPDFVDIVTTVPAHRPLVELAASRGIPVICQKPFASTMEDARAMVAACAAAGVPLMVHENFRFQGPLTAVKAAIRGGAVGDPTYARIQFRHAHDIYAGQPYLLAEQHLAIMDLGIHLLDVARDLLGEATRLHCRTQRINPRVAGEDSAVIVLDHEGGAVSYIDFSFAAIHEPDPFPQTFLRIEGDRGTLELLQGYRLKLSAAGRHEERDVEPAVPSWGAKPWHAIQDSVRAIQQHFVDCLRAGKEPSTSGADNLKTLDLVFRAYESAATGRAL